MGTRVSSPGDREWLVVGLGHVGLRAWGGLEACRVPRGRLSQDTADARGSAPGGPEAQTWMGRTAEAVVGGAAGGGLGVGRGTPGEEGGAQGS